MNTTNSQCPDVQMSGNCTKGEDCPYCAKNINVSFNPNAKNWVPKKNRDTDGTNTDTPITKNEIDGDKLKFNLSASEYVPTFNQGELQNEFEVMDINEQEEMEDEENEGEEFDMIMKDIINNEVMEQIEDDESDDEKWFPKYKDCECCKGFVYKCNGSACVNMGACYCKMKEECDDEDDE
jgi:hypothetical protein